MADPFEPSDVVKARLACLPAPPNHASTQSSHIMPRPLGVDTRRMADHNTRVERTPAAGSGFSWYGRCSCGWHGHLRISQQGAKDDAASHQQAAIPSRSRPKLR